MKHVRYIVLKMNSDSWIVSREKKSYKDNGLAYTEVELVGSTTTERDAIELAKGSGHTKRDESMFDVHLKVAQKRLEGDLYGDRTPPNVRARELFVGYMLEHTNVKLKELGRLLLKDHSTVIHSRRNHQIKIDLKHLNAYKGYSKEFKDFTDYMNYMMNGEEGDATFINENLKNNMVLYN